MFLWLKCDSYLCKTFHNTGVEKMVIVGSGGPYNYSPPLMHQINITAAVAGCLTLSASYVASLYIWPGALYAARDDPQTIRWKYTYFEVIEVCIMDPTDREWSACLWWQSFHLALFHQSSLCPKRLSFICLIQITAFHFMKHSII